MLYPSSESHSVSTAGLETQFKLQAFQVYSQFRELNPASAGCKILLELYKVNH